MLVTFESKAYANITYFGDVAKQLLHMMGHSGAVPGAILADDVPSALARLQAALARGKDNAISAAESENDDDSDGREPPIQLKTRALPLIELLSAAGKARCDVMWR